MVSFINNYTIQQGVRGAVIQKFHFGNLNFTKAKFETWGFAVES